MNHGFSGEIMPEFLNICFRLLVPAATVTVEEQRQEGAESVNRKWTHLHRRLSQRAEEQTEEEVPAQLTQLNYIFIANL